MTIKRKKNLALALVPFGLAALATLSGCSATNSAKDSPFDTSDRTTFATPEAAVAALADVAGTGDVAKVDKIFGANSTDLLSSGDEVADHERAVEMKELIQEKVSFEDLDDQTKAALFGNDAWPFPIPLLKVKGGWCFDTEAGREEIENRRIGLNELETLATLHAVVDAQREYYAGQHGGRAGAYAQRLISTKGKQDGLYWPTPEGKKPSPLGPLVAEASAEGYATDNAEPTPFHGYYYRMMTGQGRSAAGGAKSYLDSKGAMTKGFAMVAWPAKYGNSGQMTFVVDHKGMVFQKDLGEQTSAAAAAITSFDPDDSWAPTGD